MVTRERVRVLFMGEGTVTPSGSQRGLPCPPSPLRARVVYPKDCWTCPPADSLSSCNRLCPNLNFSALPPGSRPLRRCLKGVPQSPSGFPPPSLPLLQDDPWAPGSYWAPAGPFIFHPRPHCCSPSSNDATGARCQGQTPLGSWPPDPLTSYPSALTGNLCFST